MVTIYSWFESRSAAGSPGARAEPRRFAAVVGALVLAACAPASGASLAAPAPPPERALLAEPAKPPQPAPRGDCALPERPAPSGPFSDEFQALESLSNVGRLAIGVDQPRYGARPVRSPSAKIRFPKVRFHTIDAHAYRYFSPLPAEIARAFPGCDEHVLDDDGRVCPSATLPAKQLSSAQAAELLSLTALPDPRFRLRCDFDPHHAFVFRDAESRPVAEIQVCFGCGEWMLDDEAPRPLPEGAFVRLAALCRELALGGCPVEPKDEPEFWRAYRAWLELGAPPRPSAALGIASQTHLSKLGPDQRRKLCAYRAAEAALPGFDPAESERRPGLEFEDGRAFWLQTYDECLTEFPNCDVPLASVEGVAFHRTRAPGRSFAQSSECLARDVFGPNGECIWGIRRVEP